jgi:predicted nucleic acid-binding protein
MSVIVCNAGPLIALAGIGQLGLLRDLFGEVLVADEVRSEVEAGGKSGTDGGLLQATPWLRVASVSRAADPLLASLLDRGEAATITLALEKSAALVLMDEVKGRRVARDIYGLAVVGTGRLLVEARKASLISEVRPWIEQMRKNGYWVSDKIAAEILRQAGE